MPARIRNPQIKRLSSAGRTLKGAPAYVRASSDIYQRRPWLQAPRNWGASNLEWIVWWYLTIHGVEPGRRKLRNNIDFFYQQALSTPGLQVTPFSREDFILTPTVSSGGMRGTVLDPYTTFTHPDPRHDANKRIILNGQGYRLVFLYGPQLEADPFTLIEAARQGRDLSPRGSVGGFR